MIIAMLSLVFWQITNSKMPRKPDTLVNTWLLMCASGFVVDFKDRPLAEIVEELDRGDSRFWFRKATGVDDKQRWMIESEDDQASRRLVNVKKQEQDRYF